MHYPAVFSTMAMKRFTQDVLSAGGGVRQAAGPTEALTA